MEGLCTCGWVNMGRIRDRAVVLSCTKVELSSCFSSLLPKPVITNCCDDVHKGESNRLGQHNTVNLLH